MFDICLSFRYHVRKPLTGKSSPYAKNKGYINPVLHLGNLCSKAGFFSELKTWQSYTSQTSFPTFLVVFFAVSLLKNTVAGLVGSQEMCIWLF